MGYSELYSGQGGYQFNIGDLFIRLWIEFHMYMNHMEHGGLLIYEAYSKRSTQFFKI